MTWPAAVIAGAFLFLLGLALGVRRCPEPFDAAMVGWRELERVDSV